MVKIVEVQRVQIQGQDNKECLIKQTNQVLLILHKIRYPMV
jgi:hypothetical protein